MKERKILRTTGLVMLIVGVVGAIGTLLVRDQMARHRRDLFSPHPLRRLAALGYLSGLEGSVDTVQLLRDFIAWEPRPMLRRRAAQILARMERRLAEVVGVTTGDIAR